MDCTQFLVTHVCISHVLFSPMLEAAVWDREECEHVQYDQINQETHLVL
jgi:hypothetical protein